MPSSATAGHPGPGRRQLPGRPIRQAGLAAALLLCLCWPVAARAADPPGAPAQPAAEPTSVWLYSLYKTITYETVANLADIPLYSTVLAGAQASTALFTGINVASAAAAYYTFEVAWNVYGPSVTDPGASPIRLEIEKTLLYRVVSTTRNIVLAYVLTGNTSATLSFVLINNLVDAVVYVGNEYGWYRYGPPIATVWRWHAPERRAEATTGFEPARTATGDKIRRAGVIQAAGAASRASGHTSTDGWLP